MHTVQRVSSLRAAVKSARDAGKRIAFVPTMGNLHEGHLALVKAAQLQAEFVVVSIYVNPTQFGANEDLSSYPSTPQEDARALAELGTDLLFLPDTSVMYPGEIADQTVVSVPKLGERYCGQDRPVHFDGVTTIVSRLFNMVQPDVAVFGKKDYQQLAIIRKMALDLGHPIEIIGVDTVRNKEGLALSSRNGYLTPTELATAPKLQKTLRWMSNKLKKGGSKKAVILELEEKAKKRLSKAGFIPHYVAVCRQADLLPAKYSDKKLVILAAAQLGKARLIDNLEVDLRS